MDSLPPKTNSPLPAMLLFSLPTPDPLQQCEYRVVGLEEIHNRCPFSSQLLETHSPSLKAQAATQHHAPCTDRKDGSRAENEGATPGKSIQTRTKGNPLQTWPED